MGVSCTYSLKRLCKRHDEGTPLSNDATRFTPCLRTSSTGGQPLQDLWNNHFELSTSSNNINPVPTHHKEPGQYCTTMCHSRYCFFFISAKFETMWNWISDSSSWRPFLLQFSVDRHPLSLDDFWRSWAISCKMGSQLQTCGCFGVGGHFKQREGDHHQHQ